MGIVNIAIHHREGSFSDRWIEFCIENNIQYKLVNCFSSNIIAELKNNNFTHLMWHINHASVNDLVAYPNVMNAADNLNIKTFPNFNTRWHFDDKVAQKYLLESLDAPLIDSYVFYEQDQAIEFIEKTQFPLVAKLKRGAGATNVELLLNKTEAVKYINQMFTTGRSGISNTFENFNQKYRVAKKIKNPVALTNKLINYIITNKKQKMISNPEKGYVYFQKFLEKNNYDTRIIVIGKMAFGIRRFNRENDFRASGSGKMDYDCSKINTEMIRLAFETSYRLNAQCLAYDFVYEKDKPRIIEVCFGFSMLAYDACEGFWDEDLNFIKGNFNPQRVMIEGLINS